ncbi:hypothetical protein SAMN05660653_01785 [Desulfonatronum thiosulfatophilum]|uniref:Uncharacterized protein n=1 Tax=Desulfonatronum thiosulfatophilum TaxID=617002 RepID=A0A1G6CWX0_9BACT|nr:hypothetical protein SAMN05660653_01785 [Desulfonatronum thiosulfatophilum]
MGNQARFPVGMNGGKESSLPGIRKGGECPPVKGNTELPRAALL